MQFRLACLVLACVLPVWIAAGLLVYHNYKSRRALTEQHMLDTARALSQVVDRDLANLQATLAVLATSPALTSGDMAGFYRQAKAVLQTHPGANIIVSDATGQQLLNTVVPFGTPLPKRSVPDIVRQVFATGKPAITNVYRGKISGRFRAGVEIPVMWEGQVIYDLTMAIPYERFNEILLQQHFPPEWVGRIFDGNQVAVARTRLPEKFIGRQAMSLLAARIRERAEGSAEVVNFEGVRMFNSFSRSAASGWTVVIGIPKATMMAEIWRWLSWAVAGAALLSFFGILVALRMARRISGSIQGLVGPAMALGRGEPIVVERLDLAETNEVGESLVKASQLIQQRAAERERAEAARRETEELKRVNAELERSEAEARALAAELAAIMDAVPAATLIAHDTACDRMTCNPAGYELLCLPPGCNASKSAPEAERAANYRILQGSRELLKNELPVHLAAATGSEIRDWEHTIVFEDGSTREIFGNAVPLLDTAGKLRGAVGAFIDITELKQAQAAMARLAAVVESSGDAIWTHTPDGIVRTWNEAATRLFGYSAEDMVGQDTTVLVPADRKDELLRNLERARRGERIQQMETVRLRKGGVPIDVSLSVSPILLDGKIAGSAVIARDSSEQKAMERALRGSEERFQLAVRATKDLIWDWDFQSGGIWRSAAYWAHFGYEPPQQEPDIQEWLKFIHPDDRERVNTVVRTALERDDRSYEYSFRVRRADGSYAPALCRAAIIREESGRPIRAVGAITDLSDRFQLEEQLRQSQKLEAIGRLAGGIAHDFNNVLMVISSYAQMLEECHEPDKSRRYLEQIQMATERAASLTQQMLAFSRKQVLTPKVVDLNATVEQTAAMIKRVIGEDIELLFRPGRPLWPIEVDPGQITQVLLNLCVNARDAMPDGGRIAIETQNVTVDQQMAAMYPGFTAGEHVMLSVTDTGQGMTKEVRDRIFEPFFTTKEIGKGTGLGLSTVYGIVKQSGGYICVSSEPGNGSCFTLYFPKSEQRPRTPEVRSEPGRGSGETILLVEDEDALRRVITEHLQTNGYSVLEASNGEEALRVAQAYSKSLHLLLTDMVMPTMGGRDLALKLSSLHPGLKSIYMSGYTDDEMLRHDIRELGSAFLQKPFTLDTLSRKVREALGQTAPTA